MRKNLLLVFFLFVIFLILSYVQLSSQTITNSSASQSSTGEMRVYFSQSVDNSYARFGRAAQQTNIFNRFAQRVNSAKYSIDLCFYLIGSSDFDSPAQVLINAYNRGVKVRIIYDYDKDRVENNAIQLLKSANIPMISDKFGSSDGDAAMHNKFMIVDYRDKSSASDDWLWTGSYNLTKSATVDNAENAIEIQDQALAACYTLEFNEMWGSDTDTPDPTKSKFSYRKTNNTPHVFNINGIEIQQYMSPSDQGVNQIVNAIQSAQSSIYFCMLIFQTSSNPTKIADAMKARWLSIPNFKVKGVFDEEQNFNSSLSQYYNMMGTGSKPWNPPADVYLDKENYGTLHHKYLIIDSNGSTGQSTVITGSYNWSNAAETFNDENFLIIKDSTIANLYLQEFAARYHKAGGTDELTVTSVEAIQDRFLPTAIQLSQNYPNPFNSVTTINYQLIGRADQEVELAIFNLLGQKIKTLVSENKAAGFYSAQWDGKNEAGESVSSGIYVYQLKADDFKMEKKLILLQ